MPRTVITPELADTLRLLRIQNNISAKDLSVHINKSPSYITKLEKCYIKSVDSDLIDNILKYITNDDTEGNKLAEEIFSTLKHKYSKEEIDQQVWFTNYDTVFRQIPVSDTLIEFINSKIQDNNISIDYLLSRINSNEALPDEDKQDASIANNIWYASKACNNTQAIKIKMHKEQLATLLVGKLSSAPYYAIMTILFYILKIEKFKDKSVITDDEYKELMDETKAILNSFKFYSLIEKANIIAMADSKEQLSNLLNTFDYDNQILISEVLSNFKLASDFNVKLTNDRLKLFLSNLNWDLWFTLKIISFDFYKLETIDIDSKKALLIEVEKLLNSYINNKSTTVETY